MGIELEGQALRLLLAAGGGFGLGLFYDLLRPVRRRLGRPAGWLLDLLFCLGAGAGAFVYAMGAGSGRMGLWELAAALLGFAVYMNTLSGPVFRALSALLDLLCRAAAALKKRAARLAASTKNGLGRMREWVRGHARAQLRKRRPPEADTQPGGEET